MKILRNEEEVVNYQRSLGKSRKQVWSCINNIFDEQLKLWVLKMYERGIYLTEAAIIEKAKRLQSSLNFSLPENEQLNLKFSIGWLDRFKKRHKFGCYKSHGESGDADYEAAAEALPGLRKLV